MKNIGRALLATALVLSAVQPAMAQERGLDVAAKAAGGADVKIGKQYAVLIGIDRYAEWSSLANPVEDAKAIKDILSNRYYIDEFMELYDGAATATGIRRLFDDLIDRVGPTDSVLIYYAGHGYKDKYKTGFWIPSDGGKDIMSQDRWIGNTQIRNFMTLIKARSLVLISDSCFSGDLLDVQRGVAPTIDSEYFRNALRYTAKQVLTSGASESVPDESEFARQFKTILANNTETCLDPLAMYDRIRRGVTKTLPLLGTLPGHEIGASFVLFLKDPGGSGSIANSATLSVKAGFTLTVDVDKKDTSVFINGEFKGQAPLELDLKPGEIEVGLRGPFIRSWSTKAAGKAGEGLRLAPKLPSLGAIALDSGAIPDGTVVMLDGVAVDAVALATGFPVEPGLRTLRIDSPFHRSWETVVSVRPEELSRLNPELILKLASIRVNGVPADAIVNVTGQGYSESGHGDSAGIYQDLKLGDYAVTVSHPLWVSTWSAKLSLMDEKEYAVDVPTGWIELTAPPEGSLVSLNGKRIETFTSGDHLATVPLLAGNYRLAVTGTYIKRSDSDLIVEAGKPTLAMFDYEEFGLLNLSGTPGVDVAIVGAGAPATPVRLKEGLQVALPGGRYIVKAKKSDDIAYPWSTAITVVARTSASLSIPSEAGKWSVDWRIRDEESSLSLLRSGYEKSRVKRKASRMIGTVGLVTGSFSGVAAGVLYFLGSQAMDAYRNSVSTNDALEKRATADLYNKLFIASASVSGAGLSIGGILLAAAPNPASLESMVDQSIERLQKLEAEKVLADSVR